MMTPAKPHDPLRDLDHDGDVDLADNVINDLDRDGRIDGEDREIHDLDNDNDIDAADRELKRQQEQQQSVGAALGMNQTDGKWQKSQSLQVSGPKLN
jgi:hypothetical protein